MSDSEEEYDDNGVQFIKEDIHKKLTDKYIFKNPKNYSEIYDQLSITQLTQKDFDNFILAAASGKSSSFIARKYMHYYGSSSKKLDRKNIIKLMFTKFTPNDKQIKLLCSCYSSKNTYNVCYDWIDILLEKGYEFNDIQKSMLSKIGYSNFYKMLGDEITFETIIYYANELIKDNDLDVDEFIFKLESLENKLSVDYLKLFLTELKQDKYYNENIIKVLVTLINHCQLDNSIFQLLSRSTYYKNKIVLALIDNIKLPDDYISLLLNKNIFGLNLELLFRLITKQNYQITINFLNQLISTAKFSYCNCEIDIDFDKINFKYDDLISFNINKKLIIKKNQDGEEEFDEDEEEDDEYVYKNSVKSPRIVKRVIQMKGVKKTIPLKAAKIAKKAIPIKKYESSDESESDDDSDDDYKYCDDDEIKIRTIELFDLFKLIPNNETLKIVCCKGYIYEFESLTQKYKMVPNKECLDISVTSKLHMDLIKQIICYKITPDHTTLKCLLENDNDDNDIIELIELLIKNGLHILNDDIEKLIQIGCYLNDLERFGVEYDEKLYFVCFKSNKEIPNDYESKFKIDKKILKLRALCKSHNPRLSVSKFKDYITKNKIKPDRYCLDNAVSSGNINLYTYMIDELECMPTIFTLYNSSTIHLKKHIYNDILDKYKISHEDMMKTYDHIDLVNLQKIETK